MSFLCFVKYSHPYYLEIAPTTPPALFLLCILSDFSNPLVCAPCIAACMANFDDQKTPDHA